MLVSGKVNVGGWYYGEPSRRVQRRLREKWNKYVESDRMLQFVSGMMGLPLMGITGPPLGMLHPLLAAVPVVAWVAGIVGQGVYYRKYPLDLNRIIPFGEPRLEALEHYCGGLSWKYLSDDPFCRRVVNDYLTQTEYLIPQIEYQFVRRDPDAAPGPVEQRLCEILDGYAKTAAEQLQRQWELEQELAIKALPQPPGH